MLISGKSLLTWQTTSGMQKIEYNFLRTRFIRFSSRYCSMDLLIDMFTRRLISSFLHWRLPFNSTIIRVGFLGEKQNWGRIVCQLLSFLLSVSDLPMLRSLLTSGSATLGPFEAAVRNISTQPHIKNKS
jgi:hypothetical protein